MAVGWKRHAHGNDAAASRLTLVAEPAVRRQPLALPARRPAANVLPMPAPQQAGFPAHAPSGARGFRYGYGNRWLMDLLDRCVGKTWFLGALDDLGEWLREGSAGARLGLGAAAGLLMAWLLSSGGPHLAWLQSFSTDPLFSGYGVISLIVLSVLAGAVLLPALVGALLAILVRIAVVATLLGTLSGLAYGAYLLLLQLHGQ